MGALRGMAGARPSRRTAKENEMDRELRNGQESQSSERAGNSQGTPGKTTLTSKLPSRPPVQRQAASPAGAARTSGDFTDDPSLDAAHRGASAGMVVQRQERGAAGETAGAQGETVSPAAPTTEAGAQPGAAPQTLLTPEQVQRALTFYTRQATFWPGPKVAQVSQRLGITQRETIDADFVQAAAAYQRAQGLGVDGMLGDSTMVRLFSGAEMDRAHAIANRVTAVYESAGNYGVVQNVDVGILSYGAHQVTLSSGNLARMLQQYLDAAAGANAQTDASRTIQGYMARMNDRAQHEALRNDATIIGALRAAGREQIMRDTQDNFFSADYWVPAVQAALKHGITSQLGYATLYDAKIQGGMEDSLARAKESLGGIVGATVPRDGQQHRITEAEFLIAFNEAREGRLERIAVRREGEGKQRDADMLRSSKARPQAFEELARSGNLDLDANVDGQSRLDFRTYGGRRAQVDVPAAVGTTPATPVDGAGAQPQPAPQQDAAPPQAPAPQPAAQQGPAPQPAAQQAPAPQAAQPPATAAAVRTYQVRSGDTLGAIAQRLLGNSERWREIAQLNGITDPRALRVGQSLRIPGEASRGQGAAAGQPAAPTSESATPASAQPATVEYRVRAGDTLAEIAQRLLGNADRWQEIARASGISDPRSLRIGQVLRVPGGNPQAAAAPPQQARPDRQPAAERPGQQRPPGNGAQRPSGGGGNGGTPSWISVAQAEVGTQEVAGSRHNPRILEYHQTTGRFSDDETPWCASFVNWVLRQAGQTGTGSAAAMSFASYGTRLDRPAYGSIAVISYGGGKGHVGFVVGRQGDRLLILGGNQSNGVNVKAFGTRQIAAFVVPPGYEVPAAAFQLGAAETEVGAGGGVGDTR
jgi:uncharacterized protein (TIGR02594 family)